MRFVCCCSYCQQQPVLHELIRKKATSTVLMGERNARDQNRGQIHAAIGHPNCCWLPHLSRMHVHAVNHASSATALQKRPRSNAISTHHRLDENSSKGPNNSHLSGIGRDSMLTEYDSDRTDESRTKTSKTLRAVAKHFDQWGLLA